MTDKCFNCDSTNIHTIHYITSGCSDAPKKKTLIKFVYWCHNCEGIYHFSFTSESSIIHDGFDTK